MLEGGSSHFKDDNVMLCEESGVKREVLLSFYSSANSKCQQHPCKLQLRGRSKQARMPIQTVILDTEIVKVTPVLVFKGSELEQ